MTIVVLLAARAPIFDQGGGPIHHLEKSQPKCRVLCSTPRFKPSFGGSPCQVPDPVQGQSLALF